MNASEHYVVRGYQGRKAAMSIKVLIVDDEPHIRKILQKVIEGNPAFEVVGDCDNMTEAIIQFNSRKPDVVFMDIEINGGSGIDSARVIRELNPDTKIIFATAHSEYMSNAFEIYAFDYLVKPFNMDRIKQTLGRIENSYNKSAVVIGQGTYQNAGRDTDQSAYQDMGREIGQNAVKDMNTTEKTTDKAIGKPTGKSKLLIKGKENVTFVDVPEIVMVERANNNTYIYTKDGECHVTSTSLGDIEDKICGEELVRSHKSYIINISMIKKIEPYGRWTYVVFFKGIDKDALVTKEKYEQIKNLYE